MEGKKEGRHLLKGNVEERGELLNILVDILQQRNVTNGEKRTVQLHHGFNNLEAERGRESTKSKLMCVKGKKRSLTAVPQLERSITKAESGARTCCKN